MALVCPACGNTQVFLVKTAQTHLVRLHGSRVDVIEETRPSVTETLCGECDGEVALLGPDLDKIYMDALHALGEHGGWPLTMFLDGDGNPFWGGTYFPPEPRHGRPGFPQVLREIARLWKDERHRITTNTAALRDALQKTRSSDTGGMITTGESRAAALTILSYVDLINPCFDIDRGHIRNIGDRGSPAHIGNS